jgi:KDO2-lipid IV(A) lauroyltransferase
VLGWLIPRVTRHRFRRVCADMTAAFPETPLTEITALAYEAYRYLAHSVVEFLRLPAMTSEEIRARARYEGEEHIHAALAQGRGVVFVTAHIGNWEFGGVTLALSPYPVTALANFQDAPILDALLGRIREAHGLRILIDADLRACLRLLQRNECLAILADVNAKVPGAFVNVLGRPAATYGGIAYLAMSTGAALLPIFDERLPDDTHLIRVHPPVPPVQTGDRRHDLLATTMRVQHAIEREIRRRPSEWFWLLQRWKTRPEDVPNSERIPMEHRDLNPDAARAILSCFEE